MTWTTIILIGVGLSIDALGVTVANALTAKGIPWYRLMSMPIAFGLFQAIMPLIGYYSGGFLRQFLGDYGHVLTAIVLGGIGILMLKEAFAKEATDEKPPLHLTFKMLVLQAIATSIDALVVGIGFGLSQTPVSSVWVIGLTTFVITTVGLIAGRFLGEKFGRPANIFGGLLLLFIAVQSLL